MSRKKYNLSMSNDYDSSVLYAVISAIILSIFIVRIKVFTNVLNYDQASVMPSVSNVFTHYKLLWIIFVSVLLLLSFAYKVYEYRQKPNINFILLGTALVCISATVATLLSPMMKEVNIWGLYTRTNGLVAYLSLFLLIYLLSNFNVQQKHISYLVQLMNIASIILSVIAIFQFFGLDIMNSMWYKQIFTPAGLRHVMDKINITQIKFPDADYFWAPSLLGQFNYFGAYCSIVFPFITAFALNEENSRKKTLLLVGSILLYTSTILAQSMGSILALFAVLTIIPVFLVNKSNYKSFLIMCGGYIGISIIVNVLTKGSAFGELLKMIGSVMNSKLAILVMLALLMYVLIFIFRSKISKFRYLLVSISIILVLIIAVIGFIYVLDKVVEHDMGMLTNRGYIWFFVRDLVKENLVVGYGPDSLFYIFTQINPYTDQYLPGVFVDKPHNMYLQLAIDTGIIGLAGFMIILVGMLLKLNKRIDIETDVYKNTYFRALMLVIAAYMIQGIVNDNHMTIQPILYLMIGIGAAMIKPLPKKEKADKGTAAK